MRGDKPSIPVGESRRLAWRKPRTLDKIVEDPGLLYATAQVVSAANLASKLLLGQESPDIKTIGEHLAKQVEWFYEEYPQKGVIK